MDTIQIVINSVLLREIDERKLIRAYARFVYNSEEDTTNDTNIRENLTQLLDWDENGEDGLGIYCGKFESIKEKDWIKLINFIKENAYEIKNLSYAPRKVKRLEHIKTILDGHESKKKRNIDRCQDENYEVSGRGKKAKPCEYNGVIYKSRQECEYKTGISRYKLYKYLKETNQI